MATAGKGLPFIGKMNEFLDKVLHPTVQKIGHSKAGLDVIPRGYYLLNPVSTVPYVVEAGSDDNLVNLTAHGFKAGDVFRIVSSVNAISEHEITIDEIVDANSFVLAGYLSASLTAGDTFDCLRPVVERLASDGSSLSTVISPPIQYNRKSAGITAATTVLEDLDTPTNSRGLPVVIHGLDAANITVTGDQLNIASSHLNDSMRLGDGTTLTNVTLNNELNVHDTEAVASLVAIEADIDAINTKTPSLGQAVKASSVPVTLASDQGALLVGQQGTLSIVNSTSTNLAGGGIFTGVGEEVTNIGDISIGIVASHNSATLGFKFEFSPDNVTFYESDAYTYTTLNGLAVYSIAPIMKYFRIRYINGATLTTTLNIQVTYRAFYTKASSHRLEDFVNADNDAELVKAVLAAKKPDNTWTNIEATTGGNLKVAIEEFDTSLPTGTNTIGAVNQGLAGAFSWLVSVTTSVLPTGASTSALQTTGNTSLSNLDTNLGAQVDAVATTDTGTFSLIALIKKVAQNITAMSAKLPAALGITTAAGSLSIAPASDAIFNVKDKALTGTYAENLTLTTVQTFTAPANAIGAIVQADDANAASFRAKQGAAATATSGMQLQAGRDMEFKSGSDISVCSEGASVKVYVQWFIQA